MIRFGSISPLASDTIFISLKTQSLSRLRSRPRGGRQSKVTTLSVNSPLDRYGVYYKQRG